MKLTHNLIESVKEEVSNYSIKNPMSYTLFINIMNCLETCKDKGQLKDWRKLGRLYQAFKINPLAN
jgi:hypothetical protein